MNVFVSVMCVYGCVHVWVCVFWVNCGEVQCRGPQGEQGIVEGMVI